MQPSHLLPTKFAWPVDLSFRKGLWCEGLHILDVDLLSGVQRDCLLQGGSVDGCEPAVFRSWDNDLRSTTRVLGNEEESI